MGFVYILAVYFLATGSPFSAQTVSLDVQHQSSTFHHRTKRQIPEVDTSSNCPKGFEPNNGNCYYFSKANSVSKATWDAAKAACQDLGSGPEKQVKLAELGDPANLKSDGWLFQTLRNAGGDRVWFGAKHDTTADEWKWDNSQRILSKDDGYWGPTQPNNFGGSQTCLSTFTYDFVEVLEPKRHYLNDEDCSTPLHYVCQTYKKDG